MADKNFIKRCSFLQVVKNNRSIATWKQPSPLECIVLCSSLVSCASTPNKEVSGESPYSLVWSDEFEGETLDSSKWEAQVQADNWNNELQYYTDRGENVSVEDGLLFLRAREEEYTGNQGTREYTSAQIRTKYLCDWTYGQFEIKAKLPNGAGLWPAIWMLPSQEEYGSWPSSGEIDIMENLGDISKTVYGTLHYADDAANAVQIGAEYTLLEGKFSDEFHIFRLDWDPDEIRWYVDNQLYFTDREWSAKEADYPAPFDKPFYLILNVAVGGDWPGDPNEETQFPQEMIVDYVRVSQE
jgi:beta-glucanase (GH16 family)